MPPVEHRFKPGEVHNPGGLPKGTKQVKKRLRNALVRRLKAHPEQIDAIVDGLIAQACAPSASRPYGDPSAQKLIWDRLDGVLTQTHEHQGQAVQVNVIFEDPDA